MGNVFQRSGGGSPAAVSTPVKPDHEAHVQFAREFVVELVETVPKKSEKAALAKISDKEDIVSLKSVSPSESSFQSVSTVTDNASLPDLLQPESVYKKQTDTDTDTTEYESAAETDASSPIENLIAEDLLASFQEALDKKYPASSSEEPIAKKSTDNSVSQDSDPSPLSEAYEDVSETITKPVEEVKSLDISGLCYYVSNLCLDSPKSEKDIVNTSSSITAVNDSSLCDITYTDSNSTKVNDSAHNLTVDGELISEVIHTTVSKNPELTPVKPIQDTNTYEITPTQLTRKPTEAELSEPEVEKNIKLELLEIKLGKASESVLISEKVEETENKQPLKVESDEESETKLEVKVKENSEETSKLKSEILVRENTPEPKSIEVTAEENLKLISREKNSQENSEPYYSEVKPEQTSGTKPVEVKEEVSFPKLEETSDSTSESRTTEVNSEKISEERLFAVETVKSIVPQPDGIKEQSTLESKHIKDLPEKPSETEIVEIKAQESTETKPVEILTEKSLELKLDEITTGQPPEFESVEEKPVPQLDGIKEHSTLESKPIKDLPEKLSETEIVEIKTQESTETKPVEILTEKSLELKLDEITTGQLPEFKSVEEKPVLEVRSVNTPETKLNSETRSSEQKAENTSKTKGVEISPEKTLKIKPFELTITQTLTEKLGFTSARKGTEVQEISVELSDTPLDAKTEHILEIECVEREVQKDTKIPELNVHEVIPVKSLEIETSKITSVITSEKNTSVNTSGRTEVTKEPEAKTDVNKTDSELKFEVDICSSESIPIVETPSVASVTDSVDDKLLESKDFSTSFEVLSIEKEIVSELSEDKARREESVVRVEVGAGDCDTQSDTQEHKKEPTVLTELFEICDRQQKDLELGDEKFVDGREFFTPPSNSCNLNETVVVSNLQSELSDSVTDKTDFGDFDESIAEEAEKIYQDILNASSHMSSVDCTSSTMADVHEENNANPFVTSSSLRRSPPPSTKHSPRSSSQGPSPSDSPRARSKLSMVNQVRDNCSPRDGSGEASPRSRSGKNSPDRRISSNRLASMEGSPKNSINAEINQSEAGPDIAEDAHLQSGDVFKDPAAFDFLNSIGNSNTATDLRKESLYVKFDPLVGSRTVDHSVPLPPAVEARSNNITTPPRNDAISVVDKLISLSPSPRRQQQIVTPVKHEEPDNSAMVEELYLLREILAKQDEKHREDILKLQHQIECLQAKLKENEEREAGLNKKVAEKAQGQKQMSIIMEEYEKTISRLVAEKEEERQAHELDKSSLAKERDTAMGHLGNIEIAFSDLHKKYERSKTVIEGFKKNEEVLRASLAEYEATIRKQEQKYDVLKSHAMAQLENANQELDSVRRSQQAEAAKLKAMLKKAEVKTSSLEEMLEQKVKENQELASICDELINKVGSSQ